MRAMIVEAESVWLLYLSDVGECLCQDGDSRL